VTQTPGRRTVRPRLLDRELFAQLAPATADWFALYLVEGPEAYRHQWVDGRSGTMMGYSPELLQGRLVAEMFAPDVAERFHQHALQAMMSREPVRYTADTHAAVGTHRTVEITMTAIYFDDECVQLLVSTRDISDRVRRDSERDSSERRLRKLMEHAPDIVWLIDENGLIQYATSSTERLLGYVPEELIGMSSLMLLDSADVEAVQTFFAQVLAATPGTPCRTEMRTRHRDGSVLITECTVTNMLGDPDVGAIVVNAHDVTERNQAIEQLAHHALHDSLTGLPNRFLVTERLEIMLANASSDQELAAAFFVDFDGFKLINDTLGHEVGDYVIIEAGRRLVEAVGTRGWVARFGGDEFVIAATKVADLEFHLALAHDIREALAVPFALDESPLHLTASVGLATGSAASGIRADTLLRNADMAMYEAKRTKLTTARLFDESLRSVAERRLDTMNKLRSAIDLDQLVLHYQPIFDLTNGMPVGVEALCRWNHPTKGLVPPADFIGIAEETGLIVSLGEWVLNTMCTQTAEWARRGLGRVQSAVNVSPKQLADPLFLRKLRAALARSGIAPSMLTVEITENLIMEDPDAARALLIAVSELGVRVAIDDFGCGYSSLAYLSRVPAHQLKIDRMFIEDLGPPTPPRGADRASKKVAHSGTTLVNAIVNMAHALGLEVVAEGVETEVQVGALRTLGCEYAQGYLLGRPMPAAEVEAVLARRVTTGSADRRGGGPARSGSGPEVGSAHLR
jgi:diguanylate cyclase (GGDEF)-like protein/PAS domain S-box-containing protein